MNIIMHYTTPDNFKLHRYEWSVPNPKAIIQIVHGLAEHCGRYESLALDLNRVGFSCIAFDNRGNGKSDGLVAHVDRFTQFTDDLHRIVMQEKIEGVPYVLLSHSLGGLISSRYLIDHKDHPFDAAVFSAPAVKADDSMAPLLRKIAGLVSAIFPKLPAAKLETKNLSRDPAVIEKYLSDPLIYRGKVRARKGHEIMKSMAYISDKFDQINLPIFIMHGSDDQITDPIGSQMLYDGAASMDKKIKLYTGLYHEIFNEPEREEVIYDLIKWIEERV